MRARNLRFDPSNADPETKQRHRDSSPERGSRESKAVLLQESDARLQRLLLLKRQQRETEVRRGIQRKKREFEGESRRQAVTHAALHERRIQRRETNWKMKHLLLEADARVSD